MKLFTWMVEVGDLGADDRRGKETAASDFTSSCKQQHSHSPLPDFQPHLFPQHFTSTLDSDTLQYQQQHHIIPLYHHTNPAAPSFARSISTFIHTPCTPPSLNICTRYTASIRSSHSRPSTTTSTPSPDVRATTLQQPHRLAGDIRPSPARRNYQKNSSQNCPR